MYNTKNGKIKLFNRIADLLSNEKEFVISCLRKIEPKETAHDEFVRSIKALQTYDSELEVLNNRESIGDVAVALPFNNPLYSFILYCFGPCLGGSKVHVRPSKITKEVLLDITNLIENELKDLKITIINTSGKEFIEVAHNDESIQTLLFTGSWKNLERLEKTFPKNKNLIYCGSGVNPFIISQDAFEYLSIDKIVNLAVSSRIYNSGQDCLCSERFYVHNDIADIFIEALKNKISQVIVGDTTNDDSEIVPLLGSGAEIVDNLFGDVNGNWHISFKRVGSLIFPSLIEVPLGNSLLKVEKYAPIFVIARYSTDSELHSELDSDFLFGATVCGGYRSEILNSYPHVTFTKTVISSEAEDSHIPFGGKRKSGFVRNNIATKDGPILFSVETTKQIKS